MNIFQYFSRTINLLDDLINAKEKRIMSALTNLDVKIQKLTDSFAALKIDIQTAFDAYKAQIAAGVDTTAEEAKVQAVIDGIGAVDQSAKDVVTPPAPQQ